MVYAHGLNDWMKISNKPFGESFRSIFKIGDLVEWKLYRSHSVTGEIEPNIMQGIIKHTWLLGKSGMRKFLKLELLSFII